MSPKGTYLDICAAHAEGVDSSLNARLSARSIDNDVRTSAELTLLDEVLCVLLCADTGTLEASVRGVFQCKVQPLVVDVDCDDLLCAIRLRNGAAQ